MIERIQLLICNLKIKKNIPGRGLLLDWVSRCLLYDCLLELSLHEVSVRIGSTITHFRVLSVHFDSLKVDIDDL